MAALTELLMVLIALCQDSAGMTETGDNRSHHSKTILKDKKAEEQQPLRRVYGREFLLQCSCSSACQEMPRALEEKLKEYPGLRKRPVESVRFFGYPQQQSVLDSLPLRPTAQIFTWDPTFQQWVPRARPQES